jgi:poly(A) polymerase
MDIYKHALHIVQKLVKNGHTAYFTGGWVRDLVMQHPSSDIDIATDAPPEKILDLFPHTILVGLAFGVVIVVIEGHQFEVSTFRKDISYEGGRRPTAIEYSDAREDASRRDFTINGMFYDPIDEKIIDYVGGKEDIKKGIIRTIGDPQERFIEDRLRMIRAVRFATRFGFHIDLETQEAIIENAPTLFPAVAMERVWQEFNKMSSYPHFDHAIIELHRLELLKEIFPHLQHKHLNEIKHAVSSYAHFPPNSPTILQIMELFPDLNLEEQVELCRSLRISGSDIKLVEYLFELRQRDKNENMRLAPIDLAAWAHLYAHPQAKEMLEIMAARINDNAERKLFLEKYAMQRARLQKHVDRIKCRKPLVSAKALQEAGIAPGKEMGQLLKEAERLAITQNLDDPTAVFNQLKQTLDWRHLFKESI